MEIKKGRGRRPVPKAEKKISITIWVKSKYSNKARKDCKEVEEKYEALT